MHNALPRDVTGLPARLNGAPVRNAAQIDLSAIGDHAAGGRTLFFAVDEQPRAGAERQRALFIFQCKEHPVADMGAVVRLYDGAAAVDDRLSFQLDVGVVGRGFGIKGDVIFR